MGNKQLLPHTTEKVTWLYWQRKSQTHPALLLIEKYEKWGGVWDNEIEILQHGIETWNRALKYKDRGYHKFHRKEKRAAQDLIKKLLLAPVGDSVDD